MIRPALALAVVLALAGCSDGDEDAKALDSETVGQTQTVAPPDEPGEAGCPLTLDQVSAAFGVPAQGGDTAGGATLACSFTFSVDGRSLVLSGVPLDQSPLPRLEKINRRNGAMNLALPQYGPGAFSYTKADPTSETGLAYTAHATFTSGSKDKHWVYKFAVLLPSQEPAYDLQGLLTKLRALIDGLAADHPLAPANLG